MFSPTQIIICWLRRDLRLDDNAALYHALRSGLPVLPLFIFDKNILDKLEDKADPRVHFIHKTLTEINLQLKIIGSKLLVEHGTPIEVWKKLISQFSIKAVFTNHDFEPYAIERDKQVMKLLLANGIPFFSYKDQVVFEKNEVVKDDGKPYTVFTPYSRKWRARLNEFFMKSYPTEQYFSAFLKTDFAEIFSLAEIGFSSSELDFPSKVIKTQVIMQYARQRDFPAVSGTSRLGIHLRFGTLSVRKLLASAISRNETFVNELIWRDFYQMILWHFPHVAEKAFKPEYDAIVWDNNESNFKKWCEGKTGYPLVDAGMRELNATGYMHNRVRMVVASFLCKHLLIDWRWGEAYFAAKLLDFDLAANNGGWQWAAGSGTDAAPYFRVFNPTLQMQKFDPQMIYVKKWIPEFGTSGYPQPIVEHEFARKRALEVYGKALKPA